MMMMNSTDDDFIEINTSTTLPRNSTIPPAASTNDTRNQTGDIDETTLIKPAHPHENLHQEKTTKVKTLNVSEINSKNIFQALTTPINLKTNRPTFSPPYPSCWSPLLRDFVDQCFIKNHLLRPSAKELLNHPFLQNSTNPSRWYCCGFTCIIL
eukprot:UN07695